MNDCIIVPYGNFKDKIRVQKDLEREMIRKCGKNKYKMSVMDGFIYTEFKSQCKHF